VQRNVLHKIERRKANWIDHILRRKWLLTHVTQVIKEEKIEVKGGRGRRPKQLLDDVKDKEDTVNLKRNHQITLGGELALEGAVDLS